MRNERNERKLGGKENLDNFIGLLKVLGEHVEILRTHLISPTMKNVTYLPPCIQNELINIIKKNTWY